MEDSLPPHASEAEQSVLGCALLDPNESMGKIIEKFKGCVEVFYDLRNQLIFNELVLMTEDQVPIDSVTLQQRLKDKEILDKVGGILYLMSLPDRVPSVLNIDQYLKTVYDKYLLRKMGSVFTEAARKVYSHPGDPEHLIDQVEGDILNVGAGRHSIAAESIKSLVKKALSTIETLHQNQGMLTGIGSGFTDLDKMTRGFQNGDMIVIAARPSMGKTSLAMNIAEHIALEQKLPVGIFSLEMTSDSLVLRMLCSRSRINLRNVADGFLSDRDFPKITNSASKIANACLFIDDLSGISIIQLKARARRMFRQHKIRFLIIDYLQLIRSESSKENRQSEISDISGGIKSLAKELKIPILVLSQLNREMEREKNRKPRLSDLRESGAIEQDSDVVGLLYKPATEDDSTNPDSDLINLIIAKQRNGPTGEIGLVFLKSITRFENISKVLI